MKTIVKDKLVTLLQVEALKARAIVQAEKHNSLNVFKENLTDKKRNDNYIFQPENNFEVDDIEREIDEYIRTIKSTSFTCPLDFWKNNEGKFPLLAKSAKKFLGIPATSAATERLFSIAGHIFSLKRRQMGAKIFAELVFLKLNEHLLS